MTLGNSLFLPLLHFSPSVQGRTNANDKLVPMKMKTGNFKMKLHTHTHTHTWPTTDILEKLRSPGGIRTKISLFFNCLSHLLFLKGQESRQTPNLLLYFILFCFIPNQHYLLGFSPQKLCAGWGSHRPALNNCRAELGWGEVAGSPKRPLPGLLGSTRKLLLAPKEACWTEFRPQTLWYSTGSERSLRSCAFLWKFKLGRGPRSPAHPNLLKNGFQSPACLVTPSPAQKPAMVPTAFRRNWWHLSFNENHLTALPLCASDK